MKFITFLGASGTVTGSSYFLHDSSGRGILVDLGMFQGNDRLEQMNFETLPLHPGDIDGVFLTHAHLDHSGRLPLLKRFGYKGPIFMTEATKTILELSLLDAAKVQQEHMGSMALYTEQDVEWLLSRIQTVPYNHAIPSGIFSVTFRNAGHILGSAFLEVFCKHKQEELKRIVFSGDIGNYPEDLVEATEFVEQADLVLIESTYGDKEHSNENPRQVLHEEIQAVEETGGALLIPSFSIERTQELLHHIDHIKRNNLIREDTPVYLDSPLAIRVTRVYQQYRSLYNKELQEHAYTDDPFEFPGLVMVQDAWESREIANKKGPRVIIAGSGMMNGGRILHHAKYALSEPANRMLFVGFQAEGTLGRALLDGEKHLTISNIPVHVQAHIRKSSSMSSHADQPKLLSWLSTIQDLSHICFVHGEDRQRSVFSHVVSQRLPDSPALHLPMKGETLSFAKEKEQFMVFGSSSGVRKQKKHIPSVSRFAVLSA